MAQQKKVSAVVIRRLPRYYRYLGELLSAGITRISSKELSEKMGVTASQIRQDLNCFGGFGQQGYGYNVEFLYTEISKILGVENGRSMIIIGAGNLGRAIAGYANFAKRGFRLLALFDNNPALVQQTVGSLSVYSMNELERFLKTHHVDIAVLTIPRAAAQQVTDQLANTGIRGIWNFSHMEVVPPPGICVENVHLSDSLMTLSSNIEQMQGQE